MKKTALWYEKTGSLEACFYFFYDTICRGEGRKVNKWHKWRRMNILCILLVFIRVYSLISSSAPPREVCRK